MIEDSELLMLAAKAAGAQPASFNGMRLGFYVDGAIRHWNPLTDDGDALRLAVKLKLLVDISAGATDAGPAAIDYVRQDHNDDPHAATRRAIVRAAAAIAKARSA